MTMTTSVGVVRTSYLSLADVVLRDLQLDDMRMPQNLQVLNLSLDTRRMI
jgi:hypothetical protein